MIHLKKLKTEAVDAALEKAVRYRLLSEPEETESICQDILAVVPGHQDALIILLLALTDKFADSGLNPSFDKALQIVEKLDTPYCRSYYAGIVFERRAKYHLRQGGLGAGPLAHQWFVRAMDAYDNALTGCDPDNQDALLRWNSCARVINGHPDVRPEDADSSEMMLDAYDAHH